MANDATDNIDGLSRKGLETRAFLMLAVVLAPFLSIAVVGGLGLSIWVYQIFAGPPVAPSKGGH